MKSFFYFGIVLLMGCTGSAFEQTALEEKLLFLIHAKHAEFKMHEANPSYATLLLTNVSPAVTYFSDPPHRQSGTMPLEDFLEQWEKGQLSFQGVPPNAGLIFYEGKSEEYRDVAIELRHPLYDPMHNLLQFEIYFIDRFDGRSLSDITLFIDSNGTIDFFRN